MKNEPDTLFAHWTTPFFMPHSRKVRRGAPYKDSGSLGRAPARRLYELHAFEFREFNHEFLCCHYADYR